MKLNVMKAKPKITDEEIQSYMDFDGLIERHKSTASFFLKIKIISFIATASVVATVVYFSVNSSESTTSPVSQRQNQITSQTVESPEIKSSDSKPIVNDSLKVKKVIQKVTQPKGKEIKASAPVTKQKIESESSTTYLGKDAFVEAEPIDGFPQLYNFFNQNLKYPEVNLKDKIEGVEIISFVIDETGNVSNLKIDQSLGKKFDEEGMRLIKAMPKWKAATLNGRPVPSKLSLPFTFSINK